MNRSKWVRSQPAAQDEEIPRKSIGAGFGIYGINILEMNPSEEEEAVLGWIICLFWGEYYFGGLPIVTETARLIQGKPYGTTRRFIGGAMLPRLG